MRNISLKLSWKFYFKFDYSYAIHWVEYSCIPKAMWK